jgi:hypothetical protein
MGRGEQSAQARILRALVEERSNLGWKSAQEVPLLVRQTKLEGALARSSNRLPKNDR